ncbi:MAG TPA: hypothetical protein VFI55_10195 [Mycobacterium sp.]|nr:hypothetical protein [Mycobacterium sp.]
MRSSTATAPAPVETEAAPHRTPRVFQIAAWVAIVAGIVFIVAVVFFSGFILGKHSGHHGGHHHKHHAMMHPHRFGGPGGPGGPGGFGGPGGPGGPGGGPSATPSPGPTTVRPSAGPEQVPSSLFRSATALPSAAVPGGAPTVVVLAG